jgi:hypothetical protein
MSSGKDNAEKKKELQQLLSEMDDDSVADVLKEELDEKTKSAVTNNREKSLANLRPWKPGQSGNPSGRPKNQFSFAKQFRNSFTKKASELEPTKKIAQELGIDPKTITVGELYAISMLTESMKGRDSIAKEIINRIDGKIPDVVSVDITPTGIDKLNDEQLKRLAQDAIKEMEDGSDDSTDTE